MEINKLVLPGMESAERPIIIAGPCSAESREQVLNTAQELAKNGVKIFRAGIWKPRTKPGGFEGVGTVGLPWLKEVKQKTGMLVSTEVATAAHVFEAIKAGIDAALEFDGVIGISAGNFGVKLGDKNINLLDVLK